MSKRKPIYNPQLRPTNEGTDNRRGLKKAVVPSQKIISVQDIPDYSTPAGASMANEEMRRLRDGLNKLQQDVQPSAGGNTGGGGYKPVATPAGGTNTQPVKDGKDGKDGAVFPWALTLQENGTSIGTPKLVQVINFLDYGSAKWRRSEYEPIRPIAVKDYDIEWDLRDTIGNSELVTSPDKRKVDAKATVSLPDFNKYMLFSQIWTPFSVKAEFGGDVDRDHGYYGYQDGTHHLSIYLRGDLDVDTLKRGDPDKIWVYSVWDANDDETEIAGDPIKQHGYGWRRIQVPGSGTPSGGDLNLVFTQTNPEQVWTIPHTLNKLPSITTVDTAGVEIKGQVVYPDIATVQIKFSIAVSGKAYLN